MADNGLWSGLERATGNMATTGMGLLKMQQDRMAQEEKMGIEREQLQTQKALANIQIEEANKRKAAYDRPVDVTVHPMFLSMPESVRPEVLKYLTSNGYVNESGIGKAGDLEKAAGAIESTAPLFNKFMRPVIDQKKQIVMGAWNELQQARSDGDQKKIAAALSKFNMANADYQDSNGKFLEHIKGLTEQEQKLAVEQAKKTGSLPTEASLAASAAAGDPVATKALELLQQGKGQGFQDVGVAEKGGNVIVFDPRSAKNYVTTPQGERTVYDPAVHGKILSRTMPQSVVINLQGQGGFSALPKDQQEQWYEQYTLTGQVPPFARGDAQGRNQFIKGWADFQAKKGSDPGDAAATRTSYKALGTSLSSQEKSRGMMGSFVRNLNEQIDKVKEIQQNRIGIRLLDLPVRELAMRAKGSGEEAVLASYLMEISREIGKLSTGSQASIAELSVAAQEKWDKIHDPNLSFKELSKVLQATKDQAGMRLRSADEEINYTKRKIKGLSGKSDTSPDRVRVKSPNGSIGTIPVGQLNDALSQGYKRVD